MDFRTILSIISNSQVIVYLVGTALIITGMVLTFRRPKLWNWRYQFMLEGLAFAASFVLLLCSLGRDSLDMFLGALVYSGTAFLLLFISLFVYMFWRTRNQSPAPREETEVSWPPPPPC